MAGGTPGTSRRPDPADRLAPFAAADLRTGRKLAVDVLLPEEDQYVAAFRSARVALQERE